MYAADGAMPRQRSAACVTDIIDDQYQVGQTLRAEHHAVPFTSAEDASNHLSTLSLGSPLFVKRTSGEWTYASLVERQIKDDGVSLIVSLDTKSDSHKLLNRDCWVRCLRLVNSSAITTSTAVKSIATTTTADTTPSSLSRPAYADHTTVTEPLCSNEKMNMNTSSSSHQTLLTNDSHDSTNEYSRTRSAPELSTKTSSTKDSYRAPLVVTVNLNAKTFIGKRRDRFRPRAKCNSVPNLLSGLDSLPAV
jgi:hypothetical protein